MATITINAYTGDLITDATVTVLAHNEQAALMNALDGMDRYTEQGGRGFSIEHYSVTGPDTKDSLGRVDYYQVRVS